MWINRASFVVMLVSTLFQGGVALGCPKSGVEKFLCASKTLRQSEAKLHKSFAALLAKTNDAEFRNALFVSEKRWEKALDEDLPLRDDSEILKTDRQKISALLEAISDRTKVIRSGQLVRNMKMERALISHDGGGKFSGFDSACAFDRLGTDDYGFSFHYDCFGEFHRQNGNRICSQTTGSASGHFEFGSIVSVVKGNKPVPVASCITGTGSYDVRCPLSGGGENTDGNHWNAHPVIDKYLLPDNAKLSRIDPEWLILGEDAIMAGDWMNTCIHAQEFPPPDELK